MPVPAMVAIVVATFAAGASIAFSGMSQTAWIGFAHLAVLFAMAGNANIFRFAAVARDLHVFHFANHPAKLLAGGLAAAVIAFAIAAIVGQKEGRHA